MRSAVTSSLTASLCAVEFNPRTFHIRIFSAYMRSSLKCDRNGGITGAPRRPLPPQWAEELAQRTAP